MTYTEMKRILLMIDNPVEKLEAVMDFGANMPAVPETAHCNEILGGIVAIITAMVDGKTPEEIKNMDLITEFNSLNINLGTGRLGGVNSMIRFLKNL